MPLDIFDEIELSAEDKILLSEDFKKYVIDEVRKEVGKLPIDKIISRIVAKQILERVPEKEDFKELTAKEIDKTKREIKTEIARIGSTIKEEFNEMIKKQVSSVKEEQESFMDKMRKKYDDIKNEVMTISGKQWFQFGGYSPQTNDLNIGDPSVEGAWRIVKEGTELVVQRLESGVWVTKGSFLP